MGFLEAIRRRPRPRLSTLLEGFVLALRSEGRTPATCHWYERRLRRLVAATRDAVPEEVTPEILRGLMVRVKQGTGGTAGPVSDRYVESYRKAWSRFFRWLVENDYLERSPLERIRPVKCDVEELPVLTEEEFRELLATQPTSRFLGARNRTMFCLLYDTGLRVGELVRIERADVDLAGGTVRVRGKGRRDRRVPLSRPMRSIMWDYLNRWRSDPLLTSRVFVSRRGDPLLTTAVNQLLRRAARKAGIGHPKDHPHAFRHTFGTMYIRNGGDEFTLMKILGHTTTSMTRRYVHMAQSDVADRHAIASPLERLGR